MTNNLPATGGTFELTPTGLKVQGNPSFTQWDELFRQLIHLFQSIPWIIGDMLNFGEAKWGEMYAQALEATGLAYDTLAGYKRVTRLVSYNEREDPSVVPFTYYKATAHLLPRERAAYIERVKSGDIPSTRALLAEVRADGNERPALPTPKAPPCPMCGETLNYDHADRHSKCKACGANFLDAAWKCEEWKKAALTLTE